MKIIWSEDAVNDYHNTIEYLLSKWTEKSAISFIEEVDSILELIQILPEIFPEFSDFPDVRRAVIRKQISLFYKIDKDTIYLVRFWNNYQNPDSLKL